MINHTLNGQPFEDICDQLKGRYPKDFKFTGWHPLCRCHVTSVLKTRKELFTDNERIMRGEPVSDESVNSVKDVPDEFTKWVDDNRAKIERAQSLPYFMRDNEKYWKEIVENIKQKAFKGAVVKGTSIANNSSIIEVKDTKDLIKIAQEKHLSMRFPKRMKNKLSVEDIVKSIAGEDNTIGSCASQCLAYAANIHGYDVSDMIGGESAMLFGNDGVWKMLCQKFGGVFSQPNNEFNFVKNAVKLIEDGKDYILGVGEHAAIVRKKGSVIEYLDMQKKRGNGFKVLSDTVLSERFHCSTSNTNNYAYLLSVEDIVIDRDMERIFGYINSKTYTKRR